MNYSFRKKNKIVKYIIIHYTGMKTLKLAYQKLTNKSSNVSAHYLITRKGVIFNLLCPKYKAWHAGKSKWKNNVNINDYSIGVELENKGHNFGYTDFSKKQYDSLKSLIFFLKKNFFISNEDIVFHSDIAPNRKEDPGERFFIKKIGINRFNNKKTKKKYTIDEMLKLYGFHISYIKNYKSFCIRAVKRSLNYAVINSSQSKKFIKDFYNLIFT
jgi:N-acetylmuramoyl-L-alanine amidase